VAGATNASLTLSALTTSDSATYMVVATNAAGTVSSNAAVLVVTDATGGGTTPVFVTQPVASQSASVGGNVTFSAAATGTPTPTYQWMKNGAPVAGATDATLDFSFLTTADSGTYLVVATNTAGSVASNAATLVVTDSTVAGTAPVFVTQPVAAQTGIAGGSLTLSASATGNPTPTYQWQKNGVPLAGATSSTLQLTALTTNDSATYLVIASNSAGAVPSSTAVLVVNDNPTSPTNVAPRITSQPAASQTVDIGGSVSLSVTASGVPAPMYQWRKNGATIAGATNSTLNLNSVTTGDAGTYTVIVLNSAGAVASSNSVLFVKSKPIFTAQPTPQYATAGTSTKFTVSVSAIPGATLQWRKDGLPISGATSSVLYLSSVTASDVGIYSVVARNELGTTTSNDAALVLATVPSITLQPVNQLATAKSNVTLTIAATGSPAPSFQWKKDGTMIAGATASTMALKNVNKSDAASYTVEVRNIAGWLFSKTATVTVENITGKQTRDDLDPEIAVGETGVPLNGLINLSVRANAGTGANGLIVGFVIDGSSEKSVLIRGVGPSLRNFGVTGALSDPQLALFAGASVAARNDDWNANENAAQIVGTSVRVGAFSLAPQTSDAALMATLQNGAYTVQLSGKDSANGVGLVEVYDAASAGTGKLVNLSVRAQVGGDEVPNVGFVVAGTGARTVMIRAVGPSLAEFGVTDAIADPQLELFRGSTRIDQNDNWGGSTSLSAAFAQIGAFPFKDTASRDAVLTVTLDPGAYTVVVSGVNGSKGVGLVEVYDLP
jgi:hypothetical protein